MTTGVMTIVIVAVAVVAIVLLVVLDRSRASMYHAAVGRLEKENERNVQSLKEEQERSMQSLRDGYERTLQNLKESHEKEMKTVSASHAAAVADLKAGNEAALMEMKCNYEMSLKEIKENHEKSLKEQIAAVRNEMTARTEEILKAREEELGRKAADTFKAITGDLTKDLQEMKKSFNESKEAQVASSATMKTHIEEAVKHLKEQTESIGNKADNLAKALRGQNKMQGCWGETLLENMFQTEGFVEGRDYDREETLRGELGEHILNEASGRKMRPDFIIHYPDSTDIIIDSKVDLKAYSDYVSAESEEEKSAAARRNLEAIKAQVDNLSKKDYSSYLRNDRKNLGYVLMFIPVYGSLQLAKSLDDKVWRDAYSKKVLITTEETLMPFLRMIRTAWVSVEQIRNQKQIIASAQNMMDRVYDLAKYHKVMGKKLDEAKDYYDKCDAKLRDSGMSIITSAKQVVALGVPEHPDKKVSEINTIEYAGGIGRT